MNNATASAAHFFLQLAVILGACSLSRRAMRAINQPPVIGEMVAGVLLGPSLLGAVAPDVFRTLFSQESRPALFMVAQLGLTLYMFTVGLEFRTDLFRGHLRRAAAVSLSGILVPFVLGGMVACWLSREGGFFESRVSLPMAVLFTGAAMSITAFPMLARIILENGLSGTAAGTIALAAGSIDDAAAWILLATVLGGISGTPLLVVAALGGGALYVLLCLKVVTPLLGRMGMSAETGSGSLGILMPLLGLGAWFTDMIGLYSVFGAFVLGLAVPRGGMAERTAARIGPLTVALLLPCFFTYSGLNTRIGLLDSAMLWGMCAVVITAAVAGKLGACYGAARFTGSTHSDALTIASLMNARGLMELILLNIGLQAGLISQKLFTMLVMMAVVTTLMAAPGFRIARRQGSVA
jgi:Kef-type K+ transport system membrane component KefB